MHVIINMLKHCIIIIIITFTIYIVCYSGGCWSGDSYATVVTYVHGIILFGGEKGGVYNVANILLMLKNLSC